MRLSRRNHVIWLREDELARTESCEGEINQVRLTCHANDFIVLCGSYSRSRFGSKVWAWDATLGDAGRENRYS
jgi:hypothetical protein